MVLRAEDNPFPSVLFEEHVDPSAPSAGFQRAFIDTDHHLKLIDSGSVVTDLTAGAAGSMATDALWDAAGDLAVGTGANTGAKLAKGAAGGRLTMSNGAVAWDSATSFPGSPATGDRFWRSDRAIDYYYDGTRWLSCNLYRESIGSHQVFPGSPASGDVIGRWTPWAALYEIYLVDFFASTFVLTTNDGTKYWTVDFQNSASTSITSFNTSADAANAWVRHQTSPNSARTAATDLEYEVKATKTSTPGGLYWAMSISYRLIG